MVGYLNENQLNVNDSYLKGYYGDNKENYKINDYHYPIKIDAHHGHKHHGDNHHTNQNEHHDKKGENSHDKQKKAHH